MKVGASLVDDNAAPLLILVYGVYVYVVVVADVPSFQTDVRFMSLIDDCNNQYCNKLGCKTQIFNIMFPLFELRRFRYTLPIIIMGIIKDNAICNLS